MPATAGTPVTVGTPRSHEFSRKFAKIIFKWQKLSLIYGPNYFCQSDTYNCINSMLQKYNLIFLFRYFRNIAISEFSSGVSFKCTCTMNFAPTFALSFMFYVFGDWNQDCVHVCIGIQLRSQLDLINNSVRSHPNAINSFLSVYLSILLNTFVKNIFQKAATKEKKADFQCLGQHSVQCVAYFSSFHQIYSVSGLRL